MEDETEKRSHANTDRHHESHLAKEIPECQAPGRKEEPESSAWEGTCDMKQTVGRLKDRRTESGESVAWIGPCTGTSEGTALFSPLSSWASRWKGYKVSKGV